MTPRGVMHRKGVVMLFVLQKYLDESMFEHRNCKCIVFLWMSEPNASNKVSEICNCITSCIVMFFEIGNKERL